MSAADDPIAPGTAGDPVAPGPAGDIAAVVIGRNEGARLETCLRSLAGATRPPDRIVYVDSGSTDGSVETARALGAEVVELDAGAPFTAARGRNAGVVRLREAGAPDLVQFVDGDCEVDPNWIATAASFLEDRPEAAVACGRRRERHPEASAYNRLCDVEWDTPIGRTRSCGGDALMRMAAFDAVGGFDPTLIAGEEPELCVRLRAEGWEIWRLDAEMTLHDADMTRFAQFWRRARRGGHAYAEGAAMHGAPPERHGVAGTRRALLWGLALPLAILVAVLLAGPWGLLLALVYPAQIARLALRAGGGRAAWERAGLLTLGKFAEARGVVDYRLARLRGRRLGLIEYK
ncbi:GT2 family glycosyltransferase [Palleronia aestuarii]|uniref:GT2 family glycosyltransferase n=1 Tax=Palleronia aestuarii TaxID=568105 RepID=A0A2W7N556_9RHOB|nr:glycosyltransferase [Palleronia aestuarii]PZX13457.1 GT2 family glycosyltransferase [Palleronia aestuarii]